MSADTARDVAGIVGAGIAGLNALFVASRYLSCDDKIILIDRRARVGGMRVDTSVRPPAPPHPMFTAGNIKWTLGQPRSYLATKERGGPLSTLRRRDQATVQLDEYFGRDFVSDEEADGIVRVTCRSCQTLVVERSIKAYGLGVTPNDLLEISSERPFGVARLLRRSIGRHAGERRPGVDRRRGKTAMDTARTLITNYPVVR